MTPDDPRPPEPDPQVPDESTAPPAGPDTSPEPAANPADPTTGTTTDPHTSGPVVPVGPASGSTPDAPASGSDASVDRPTSHGTTPTDPTTGAGPDAATAGPPGGDVDELASAMVDGLADPDEAASHRPEVVTRAAELAAARAALRDVPAIDPAVRERGLAAALAAFDDEASTSASPDRPPPPIAGTGRAAAAPVDLASHRRSRPDHSAGRGARQGLPRWFGAAAAAVVVLAGLVGLAALSSSGGDDESNTAMDSSAGQSQESSDDEAAATAEDGGEAAPGAAEDATGSEGSAIDAGDLGMFATGDALADRLRESLAGGDAEAPIQPEASAPRDTDRTASAFAACDGAPPPPLGDTDATPVLHGRAVIGDEAVDVWVMDTSQGRRIVAIDGACELVLDRPAR